MQKLKFDCIFYPISDALRKTTHDGNIAAQSNWECSKGASCPSQGQPRSTTRWGAPHKTWGPFGGSAGAREGSGSWSSHCQKSGKRRNVELKIAKEMIFKE